MMRNMSANQGGRRHKDTGVHVVKFANHRTQDSLELIHRSLSPHTLGIMME